MDDIDLDLAPLAFVPGPAEARRLADELRDGCGCSAGFGPLNLTRVCQALQATPIETDLSDGGGHLEGLLIPDEDGFLIAVDPTPREGWGGIPKWIRADLARHRTRFRIAHELAHTYFYWRDGTPRRHLVDSEEQERFCDAFAAALLVPRDQAEGIPPTVSGLLALQRRCDVSLELAARELVAARPSLMITLWHGQKEDLALQWSSSRERARTSFEALETWAGELRWLPQRRQAVSIRSA